MAKESGSVKKSATRKVRYMGRGLSVVGVDCCFSITDARGLILVGIIDS